MPKLTEKRALKQVAQQLAELLEASPSDAEVVLHPSPSRNKPHPADAKITVGGFKFVVEWKSSGSSAAVSMAVRTVKGFAENSREKLIPVVAVPYMGDAGRELCAEAGICWLDLSGNACLVAPGLRIVVEGKPNRFRRRGRPRNLFAPKSSRIARYLLQHPTQPIIQRGLAQATDMDEGFTSRIVRGLKELELVSRDEAGRVYLTDYERLLDAWYEAYDFSKHEILRGHIPARSGEDLLAKLADRFGQSRLEYAATGLAGAWLLDRFAGFRLVTVFVSDFPSESVLDGLAFREEARGENVWLVVPNDVGVFHGAVEREGIRCVHPVQVYVDLKGHPERSAEAAGELRNKLLSGAYHAD